ncbi:N-acetylglucosamine kinase [Albibacterium indicum]|uniref:N-acetylglucosamine kinase n=1 Tax=Albibacterium indicum TaxID=2292082 RepID=UPI000E51D188|nr:N-acetylglucosamine kinase [Pedobacter indicus]
MILVVDSGSFKSDWMFTPNGKKPERYRTQGINPFFTQEKEIVKIIQSFKEISPYVNDISEIYFFGSGCTSPDRREIVSNAVSHVFKNAFVSVDTDLIGSAYATCGDRPGFISTMGTGSNISFFDGENALPSRFGTGFILGDIGSGAWFGKKLVTDFLYDQMPSDISIEFAGTYEVNKEIVMKNVYQEPHPNAYLASFAPFLADHTSHDYITDMLCNGFEDFVKTNIFSYADYEDYECHFVGSIAYFYSEQLKVVCKNNHVRIGKIIQQPIQDLYAFVVEKETQKSNYLNL